MKTKTQKKDSFKQIKEKLAKARITVVTSFAQAGSKGLNVTGMRELRKNLQPLEAEFEVAKKTVLDKVLESEKKQSEIFTYQGSLGVTYGFGDPFATARTLYQFSRKNTALKLYGAYMDGAFMDGAHLMEMAQLPSREVLLGRLVGMLSYPMRGLAVVLQQIGRKE